jgi:hypothetical protein
MGEIINTQSEKEVEKEGHEFWKRTKKKDRETGMDKMGEQVPM